jgi:hypothetical protein
VRASTFANSTINVSLHSPPQPIRKRTRVTLQRLGHSESREPIFVVEQHFEG